MSGTLLTAAIIQGAVISILYISGTVVETAIIMLQIGKNKRRHFI